MLKQNRANAPLGSEIKGVFYLHRTTVCCLGICHKGALGYADRRLGEFLRDAEHGQRKISMELPAIHSPY
jgi:hypothetical protein